MICFIYQSVMIHFCLLLYGVHTISVVINGSEVGLFGADGTEIECLYTQGKDSQLFAVTIMAFTRKRNKFEQIASYLPGQIPTLTKPLGQYLCGRVKLTNITKSSTKTVMTFNKLMCIDDTSYQCKVTYSDPSGITTLSSNNILIISVQVPPSIPDSISVVHMPTDSSVTTTKHMNYSSSPPEITSKEYDTVSTMQSETMNNTTALNYYTLQKTYYDTTSSIPSNDDLSSDIRYRTTTYFTKRTTTSQRIVEGDNITVVCRGAVGKPPAEHVFEKYLNGKIVPIQGTDLNTSISEMSENCSHYRTSNLTFKVTSKDNNAVIRCGVKSSMAEPDMYVETEPLEVYSDITTPSTSDYWLNKAKDNGTVIAIAIVVVLIVIGVVVVLIVLLYRRIKEKEEYKPVDRMESNMDQIESQETTQTVPSTSSTKKTTGYEDVDLDDTDMKIKLLSDEETIAKVKQHNEEYLKKQKEDEDREKDNPTQPPQAAVYACVNKPKNTTTTENKPPADQWEEDVYEESKEGLYDTSGDRRHKENITVENYDSTENLKNEESDHNDLFPEKNSQIGANINKTYGSSENKEEKRQVATVSPTFRLSSSSQGDGQKHKSDEIQPKTEKQTTHETSL